LVAPWTRAETKGGEALPAVVEPTNIPWRVAWTHSNCEQLVYDQLVPKGFNVFLPTAEAWTRRGGSRVRGRVPLFRGYLFLRHAVDKATYVEVCKARGIVRLLGQRWDQLEVVPDSEIDAIQKLVRSELPIFPYPFLREGERVRIKGGPLADVEGILVGRNPKKGLVVVSVELLRRSVAVRVDCTLIDAA